MPPKLMIGTQILQSFIPAFIRAAYRGSRYASVGDIRIDAACQHFLRILFLGFYPENTLGRPAKTCHELFSPRDDCNIHVSIAHLREPSGLLWIGWSRREEQQPGI